MSAEETTLIGYYAKRFLDRGLHVEYGNAGYPGEVWTSYTNRDHQWNVWSAYEMVDEPPCGSFLEDRGDHWWWGRWVRTP